MNVRLALIGADGLVETVIEAPAGSGPDFPGEILGLPGNWVVDAFVQAGPGSLYVPESGEFFSPDAASEEPSE